MVFFEISLNSQKNTFFTEHLHTTAFGFILINFSFQGNFTGQKISSNTLMLRIQYMSVRFSFVTHSIYVRLFFFLICKRENHLSGFTAINKEWVHCDESKKYLLHFGYC